MLASEDEDDEEGEVSGEEDVDMALVDVEDGAGWGRKGRGKENFELLLMAKFSSRCSHEGKVVTTARASQAKSG